MSGINLEALNKDMGMFSDHTSDDQYVDLSTNVSSTLDTTTPKTPGL